MSALPALIDRLQAATEGSRELDCHIAYAVDFQTEGTGRTWRQLVDDIGFEYAAESVTRFNSFWRQAVPHYTTSIDASLSLVPEGWGWCVGDIHPPTEMYLESGLPWAEIWRRGLTHSRIPGMLWDGIGRNGINAATPALALCIAALRARGSV